MGDYVKIGIFALALISIALVSTAAGEVNINSMVYIYNDTLPEEPSNYYYFYNDSDTVTLEVYINITPNLNPVSDYNVSANFSQVISSDNPVMRFNNSGIVDGDYYMFTLTTQ